jgi:small subunit ribosomal protein S8
MSLTDPIADMLTRIRNAYKARHKKVTMPSSKLKTQIAKILQEEGYIKSFKVNKEKTFNVLEIELNYGPNQEPAISGIKRISKPGLKVYAKKQQIPKVLGGLGIAIISTSKGVMTDRKANRENVGGEVLAYVW